LSSKFYERVIGGSASQFMGLKLKRRKVECCQCGKTFDSDYKKRHEALEHAGKNVKIKDLGAPDDPFSFAARSSILQPEVSLGVYFLILFCLLMLTFLISI
jgi:hypothetical protein